MTLSDSMRRTGIFGLLCVVCLVCWFLKPIQFLLGGVYPAATIIFLVLAVGSFFWTYIGQAWEWIDVWLGSTAAFLVLFIVFGAAGLVVYPVDNALGVFYRLIAAVCLVALILSVVMRLLRSADSSWSLSNLAPFRTVKRREAITGYLFILPWVIGFCFL